MFLLLLCQNIIHHLIYAFHLCAVGHIPEISDDDTVECEGAEHCLGDTSWVMKGVLNALE